MKAPPVYFTLESIIHQLSIGTSTQEWFHEVGVTLRTNAITKGVGVRNRWSEMHASPEARLATDIDKFHHVCKGHRSNSLKVPSGLNRTITILVREKLVNELSNSESNTSRPGRIFRMRHDADQRLPIFGLIGSTK